MEDRIRKAKEMFVKLEDNREGIVVKARRLLYIQEFLSQRDKIKQN